MINVLKFSFKNVLSFFRVCQGMHMCVCECDIEVIVKITGIHVFTTKLVKKIKKQIIVFSFNDLKTCFKLNFNSKIKK